MGKVLFVVGYHYTRWTNVQHLHAIIFFSEQKKEVSFSISQMANNNITLFTPFHLENIQKCLTLFFCVCSGSKTCCAFLALLFFSSEKERKLSAKNNCIHIYQPSDSYQSVAIHYLFLIHSCILLHFILCRTCCLFFGEEQYILVATFLGSLS